MTDLAPDALMVSLTQAAAQLPILFLVVPAGALADLVDRRRYLVLTNVWMFAMAALLAVLYGLGLVGPWLLLALTALLSVGVALNAPAWSSSVPLTVPRDDLPRAVLLNSMGFNLARAIGPALGGILVATIGAAFAFTLNAASFALVAVISGAILAFPAARPLGGLPPESKGRAILLGLRYVGAEPNVPGCDGSVARILWSSQCDLGVIADLRAPKARHVGRGLRRDAGCDRCRRDARRDHDAMAQREVVTG